MELFTWFDAIVAKQEYTCNYFGHVRRRNPYVLVCDLNLIVLHCDFNIVDNIVLYAFIFCSVVL